jgi:hypothetical protein
VRPSRYSRARTTPMAPSRRIGRQAANRRLDSENSEFTLLHGLICLGGFASGVLFLFVGLFIRIGLGLWIFVLGVSLFLCCGAHTALEHRHTPHTRIWCVRCVAKLTPR